MTKQSFIAGSVKPELEKRRLLYAQDRSKQAKMIETALCNLNKDSRFKDLPESKRRLKLLRELEWMGFELHPSDIALLRSDSANGIGTTK